MQPTDSSIPPRALPTALKTALAALLCAALAGTVSPAWAAAEAPGVSEATPLVGGFSLGDGLEALVDPATGGLTLGLSVGGLGIGWDSRLTGIDRYGLGEGWAWQGIGHLDTRGGVRVFPASSGASYEMSEAAPTGLLGYPTDDLRFSSEPDGPGRRGDVDVAAVFAEFGVEQPGEPGGGYLLRELGGVVTHFNESGDPVTRITTDGARTDWLWHPGESHRLLGTVSPDGVITALDWQAEPDAVLVRPGVNLPATDPETPATIAARERAGGRPIEGRPVWRVAYAETGMTVTDATGGQLRIQAESASGLVTRMAGPSGSATELSWSTGDDGASRLSRLRTLDDTGAEASVREWATTGPTGVTGWPLTDGALGDPRVSAGGGVAPGGRSGPGGAEHTTVVSDGQTSVESVWNASGALTARRLEVTTPSGSRTDQEHTFEYPETAPTEGAAWRPTQTRIRYFDVSGVSRSLTESTAYDRRGRPTLQTGPDGAVTRTVYDEAIPRGGALPVGLPLRQVRVSPDGSVAVTDARLNDARTTAVIVEEYAGTLDLTQPGTGIADRAEQLAAAPDLAAPDVAAQGVIRTARVVREVRDDGFIAAEHVHPGGDPGQPPVTTRWEQTLDLAAGTTVLTETVAAGTDAETTLSQTTSLRHGGTLASTDPLGNTSWAAYDLAGRPVTTTDASGRHTHVDYEVAEQHGRNATTTTGPDGVAATEVTDALGRVIRMEDNLSAGKVQSAHVRLLESRAYPAPGTTRVTDAWGRTTTSRTDVHGRPLEQIAPNGLTQHTVYDEVASRVTTSMTTPSTPVPHTTSVATADPVTGATSTSGTRADGVPVPGTVTKLDGHGRTVREDDGLRTTRTSYDAFGNAVGTELTATQRDVPGAPAAPGRPGEPADPVPPSAPAGAFTAERVFDLRGNSVEKRLSDGTGAPASSGGSRELDVLGRVVAETDRNGAVTRVEYTVDGLVARVVSGSGHVTVSDYDPVTRALVSTGVTAPDGRRTGTGYEYDPVTDTVIAMFDVDDPARTRIDYAYDDAGNLLRIDYPDGASVEYSYDEFGRRLTMTDVEGNVTSYAHTDDGALAEAVQRDDEGRELARVAYTYDDFGRVVRLDRGNGVTTEYGYTSIDELASEVTTGPDGREQSRRAYIYTPHGLVQRRVDTVADGDRETTNATEYRYDLLDRLVESTVRSGGQPDAPVTTRTTYVPTMSGDIATETTTTDPGTTNEQVTTRSYGYGLAGQLTSVTTTAPDGSTSVGVQEYDGAGNLTLGLDGTRYAYDAANRQISRTHADGSTVQTSYWASGARREVSSAAGAIAYHWDGSVLLNETHTGPDGQPAGASSYLIGATRHARSVTLPGAAPGAPAVPSYFGTDRHGNVADLTDRDGLVTARYTYADYGAPISADRPGAVPGDPRPNPYGYSGEYTDADGTQFLTSRIYDSVTHRFMTEDTAELHSVYAYGDLNPITNIDPSGQTATWDMALSWVFLGLGVALAAMSVGIAAVTVFQAGWTGLGVFGIANLGIGVAGDAAAVASSTAVLLNHYIPKLIDPKITNGLMWAETSLGLGALGFLGLAYRANAALRVAMKGPDLVGLRGPADINPNQGALAWDRSGAPVIWEATHMTSDEISTAIRNLMVHHRQAQLEFVMIETKSGPRVGFGVLDAADALKGNFTASAPGMSGKKMTPSMIKGGSNHEILVRLMGEQVDEWDGVMNLRKHAETQKHISGGMLSVPYLRKYLDANGRPTGYKMNVAPASGHYAKDSMTAHWNPRKQRLFADFWKKKGFKIRMVSHEPAVREAVSQAAAVKVGRDPVARPSFFDRFR